MVLASQEDVIFRVPVFLCLRISPNSPLGFLLGGGVSSWNDNGIGDVFAVFYGGLNCSWGGRGPRRVWSLTGILSDTIGSGLNDIMLELYFGRIIGF
jgi:hypothetical protein